MLLSPADPELFFQGRPGDPRIGEWVSPQTQVPKTRSKLDFVIVGFPDDTGVERNRGRAGAKLGPDTIRRHLYRMTPPMDLEWEKRIRLWDWGNIIAGEDIAQTHLHARQTAEAVAKTGATLIALGGGHDFAAPNFGGFRQGKKKAMGLINVDPHLDVRPLEDGLPHSGTPFRVLLEEGSLKGPKFVEFGIRANRNARTQFQYCRQKKVTVQTLEAIRARSTSALQQFQSHLARLGRGGAPFGVTFDMDTCYETEGTSAAPVLGFSAWEMVQMAERAGRQVGANYFEIAEVAPPLEPAERSARIAAEMIFAFLRAKAGIRPRARR